MTALVQTTEDKLITCAILTNNNQILNKEKVAQRGVNDTFDKEFMTCMDNTNTAL